jgi:uncharacterized membrane protein
MSGGLMLVTLYTRGDIPDCKRVRTIVDRLAPELELQVAEAPLDECENAKNMPRVGALPAIEVAGSRLGMLDSVGGSLDEATIRSYLRLALASAGSGPELSPNQSPGTRNQEIATPNQVKSYLWRHRVGVVISSLSAFLGLAWLAPLLSQIGMRDVYAAVYSAYRLVCVQTPERTPSVGGEPCCLCWRCVAIYGGSLLMGILYTLGRDGRLPRMGWLTRPVGLGGLVLFGLPMILDGLSHMLGLRPGVELAYSPDFWLGWQELQFDWWVRITTALVATIGATRFLCPRLDKIAQSYSRGTNENVVKRPPGRPVVTTS